MTYPCIKFFQYFEPTGSSEFFHIVTNLQKKKKKKKFQCIYWKIADYKWTYAVQTHIVEGSTVVIFGENLG